MAIEFWQVVNGKYLIYISNLSSLSNNCCPIFFFFSFYFFVRILNNFIKEIVISIIYNSHNYFSLSSTVGFGKTYRTTLIYFIIYERIYIIYCICVASYDISQSYVFHHLR